MDPGAEAAIREACTATVQEYFPDMCPDHLEQVALERGWDAELVIAWFLDQQESGAPYPKRPRGLKRKREEDVDSDDEGEDGVVAKAVNKYLNVEREECGQDGYNRMRWVCPKSPTPPSELPWLGRDSCLGHEPSAVACP